MVLELNLVKKDDDEDVFAEFCMEEQIETKSKVRSNKKNIICRF